MLAAKALVALNLVFKTSAERVALAGHRRQYGHLFGVRKTRKPRQTYVIVHSKTQCMVSRSSDLPQRLVGTVRSQSSRHSIRFFESSDQHRSLQSVPEQTIVPQRHEESSPADSSGTCTSARCNSSSASTEISDPDFACHDDLGRAPRPRTRRRRSQKAAHHRRLDRVLAVRETLTSGHQLRGQCSPGAGGSQIHEGDHPLVVGEKKGRPPRRHCRSGRNMSAQNWVGALSCRPVDHRGLCAVFPGHAHEALGPSSPSSVRPLGSHASDLCLVALLGFPGGLAGTIPNLLGANFVFFGFVVD